MDSPRRRASSSRVGARRYCARSARDLVEDRPRHDCCHQKGMGNGANSMTMLRQPFVRAVSAFFYRGHSPNYDAYKLRPGLWIHPNDRSKYPNAIGRKRWTFKEFLGLDEYRRPGRESNRAAAPPRLRRGHSVEMSRGAAAAAKWIFREDASLHRHVDIPRRRVAATTWIIRKDESRLRRAQEASVPAAGTGTSSPKCSATRIAAPRSRTAARRRPKTRRPATWSRAATATGTRLI